jgi:hypothetical protein
MHSSASANPFTLREEEFAGNATARLIVIAWEDEKQLRRVGGSQIRAAWSRTVSLLAGAPAATE